MDTNRFTQKSLEALQAAQQLAQSYGNAQVEQVHLLDALLSQENGLIGQLMGKLGLNVQQVRTACESAVNRLPKISGSNQQPYVTASLSQALTEAENQMKQMRDEYISVEHLFLGLLEKADSTVRPLFASLDITKSKFLEALQAVRGSARVTSEDPESTYDALKKYGQDLVELARQNKLDPAPGLQPPDHRGKHPVDALPIALQALGRPICKGIQRLAEKKPALLPADQLPTRPLLRSQIGDLLRRAWRVGAIAQPMPAGHAARGENLLLMRRGDKRIPLRRLRVEQLLQLFKLPAGKAFV